MTNRVHLLKKKRETGEDAKPEPEAQRKKNKPKPKKRHDVSESDTTNDYDSRKDTDCSLESDKEQNTMGNEKEPIWLQKNGLKCAGLKKIGP